MQNDILCLTETQLYINEDTSDIATKFQNNFSMYYNSSTDKHRSIAFRYSSNIFLCESSNICSMSLVNGKISTFLDEPVKVTLLYRPPNSPSLFLQNTKSWIDEKKPRYFAWGFQYKCFVYRFIFKLKTHAYKLQIVSFSTNSSFSGHKTTVAIKNIYFSDHDAVILHISPNRNNDVNEDIDFNVV